MQTFWHGTSFPPCINTLKVPHNVRHNLTIHDTAEQKYINNETKKKKKKSIDF